MVDTDARAAREVVVVLSGAAAARPDDLDHILTSERPDLVIDATRRDHAAQARAAGVATLVEKSLATTTEDALAFVHADARGRLHVGHNLHFTNLHTHIRALLADGHIGTVTGADFPAPSTPRTPAPTSPAGTAPAQPPVAWKSPRPPTTSTCSPGGSAPNRPRSPPNSRAATTSPAPSASPPTPTSTTASAP